MDRHDDENRKRPIHTVEPSEGADRDRGAHEVEPPEERADDEIGSDHGATKRQE